MTEVETTDDSAVARAPGRPRDMRRHARVLEVTRELLAESGYNALTFSDVATRAGVTRHLLYRWWPVRASLVAEAVFANPDDQWPTTYDGPLQDDLRTLISAMVAYASRPYVTAGIIGLMAEAGPETDLPGLETGLLDPLETSLVTLLSRARDRGEIRLDVDARLTLNTLRGAIVMHLIADRTPPTVIVDHLTALTTAALASR
jgi:AcrR family transcriptional regulator